MSDVTDRVTFEKKVKGTDGHTKRIDAYIPETHVLIEQKSKGIALDKAQAGHDGMTPYEQAKYYDNCLGVDEKANWIITSNFQEIWIYNMHEQQPVPTKVALSELQDKYKLFDFMVRKDVKQISHEVEVSMKAGEIVGLIYDALLKQYRDPEDPESLRSLNILCVRIVFCLYAEDAGLFGSHTMFHDYLEKFPAHQMRKALIDLFRVLDEKPEDRDPYLADDDPELAAFPYVNGGLFADERIEIPPITEETRDLILVNANENFDWAQISPTIFGAVFESTLNKETRRSGGMHYTSLENIHKVIDPLFLDDLKTELEEIRDIKVANTKRKRLLEYQDKLASLQFLDPAAGSGNFLTETYLSLRRLENEVLIELRGGQIVMGDVLDPIKVSISQFHGIEINDFAVSVAKTALWIAESQMMQRTAEIVSMQMDFLPLKTNANIVEGNALRMDWNDVIPAKDLNYIMGNPPFVGARIMSSEQKADVQNIFEGWKNIGNLDYVACWYKKAADLITGSEIRVALVSTNSISQGEAVGNLWAPLFERGVHIDFAYRTFQWDSEAKIKAHVHCVIVGFSTVNGKFKKRIFSESGECTVVTNINGYLIDAPNVCVASQNTPLCDIPKIGIGNKPIDGGFYLFTKNEMQDFILKEPKSESYFRPWYGSREFINRDPRYCLWLGDCTPGELRKMPECLKRIEAVRNFRLSSKSTGTVKLADKPTHFHVENMPGTSYIIIPKVSSERRRYVPMGLMTPNELCSDLVFLVPNATIYHFGILESNVHMSWMRVVCGRLKSDYRYSKDIVYNNFPWPTPTDAQREKIEKTAQGILDARDLYPDSSLADLYDPLTMPPELRKAHQANDLAVMRAYGFDTSVSEADCVAELMKMYQKLVEDEKK